MSKSRLKRDDRVRLRQSDGTYLHGRILGWEKQAGARFALVKWDNAPDVKLQLPNRLERCSRNPHTV